MTTVEDGFKGRVLVLGGRGMLGREVCRASRDAGWQTWAAGPETNIADFNALQGVEHDIHPHVVVNCAGIVPAKTHTPAQMVATNALGPWVVREAFFSARVIHVSTDCVFDGRRESRPYNVLDRSDAVDVYGRTKAMGECPDSLNVRTSFIGFEHGLLAWLLSQPSGATIDGWAHAVWSGGTVVDVAEGLVQFFASPLGAGTVHLASYPMTKYTLLQDLIDIFELNIGVTSILQPRINRALKPTHHFDRKLGRLKEVRDASQRVHSSRP